MIMQKLNVQYGCGLTAPEGWLNFDASPTLYLQKIPVLSFWAKRKVDFPKNVLFGNILAGLPGIKNGTCDAVFCSHVLEHLSLEDFHLALRQTYDLLKPGGIFRAVLPDLAFHARNYLKEKESNPNASVHFLQATMLGVEVRKKKWLEKLISLWGNAEHLWMWDHESFEVALRNAGFTSIRRCEYGDSADKDFSNVEQEGRFWGSIAFECIK